MKTPREQLFQNAEGYEIGMGDLMPVDFADEERRRMLEDSQPLNWWGIFLAFVGSLTFWAVVVGVALATFR